ncbi:MAG: tRNA (N(6)-L-threonylcarbamoyladenosine(37)-C(2))-methylthiotransferase MtaB, partial [Synergistaceae bacterium]|nr:tRNA (N(6)-L-threonylcarbamoyladenosine(37)-C(2))-methylthiotransferase MtaB [Synergistaceae bacterium]NLV82323.1 tRNA (N(6)-L-threonylcarbamoyladenosine(37)-C(2))-methylthiotransferase MtaB [Synergistaceae bacterium]
MNRLKGKTFSINIQGCRTNLYEGEAITYSLEKAGAIYKENAPDVVVIVSCTITSAAERKCRKLIRKIRRESPLTLIIVCGCYAQKLTEEERQRFGIDILVG